jgi:NADPH2:quinone reductase
MSVVNSGINASAHLNSYFDTTPTYGTPEKTALDVKLDVTDAYVRQQVAYDGFEKPFALVPTEVNGKVEWKREALEYKGSHLGGYMVAEVGDAVSGFAVGDRVWTTMQGLGGVRAERDGGYAEYLTVSTEVLSPLPTDVDPVGFAAIGLAGVTALEGMRRLGPLAGKTLLVSGATGGVGSLAVEIGRALGARVIGLERSSPPPEPGSVDAVLDGVAGSLFPSLVAALRPEGRYCLVGAAAGGEVAFDAWSLLDGRALTGYSTETLDGSVLRSATRELLALRLASPPTTVLPLAEAARAHALLEQRAVRGRVVLVP